MLLAPFLAPTMVYAYLAPGYDDYIEEVIKEIPMIHKKAIRWTVVTGILIGIGFLAGALSADTGKEGLAALLPAQYTQEINLTVIEADLMRACPLIQAITAGTGTVYWGFDLGVVPGKIRLRLGMTRPVWDREAMTVVANTFLKKRYPTIPTKVWAIEVTDFAKKRTHTYTEGKWTEGPLIAPK